MNIAVCFGGEPRTYDMCAENIHNFFNIPGRPDLDVKFFAHTWTNNTYKTPIHDDPNKHGIKIENENLNLDFLKEDLQKFYNFEKLKIEDKFPKQLLRKDSDVVPHDNGLNIGVYCIDWDHLFYSDFQSNLLKRIYELENNMTFDIVVKMRFDLSFNPEKTFLDLLDLHGGVFEKIIYSSVNPMFSDYYRVQMDDCLYYGSSFSMDLLQSNMWFFNRGLYCPNDLSGKKFNDPFSLAIAGPGVRLATYCNLHGLNLEDFVNWQQEESSLYFIYRNLFRPQNPISQWKKLLDEARQIY